MTSPSSPTTSDEPFLYDAFISYRQRGQDMSWTRGVLLPSLERANLKICIDFRDFTLGAALVSEIGRAIEHSRYTLAILSPHYLDSKFTELESVLAEHLGLESGQRRLICVMRRACSPRIGLRSRLWLDMSEDSAFESTVQHLINQLRLPPG